MNVEGLLGSLIGGALGARHKPHARVGRFLTGGNKSFLNAGTLLTAAALGFGAYEIWRTRNGAAATNATIGGGSALPPPMPPIPPGSSSRSTVDVVGANPVDGVRRIAALLVSAARCDGELSESEYARILERARSAGADQDVLSELTNPRPLESVVAGVSDPKLAADLYTLAFAVVRADQDVKPAERAWLDRLAALLRLDRGSIQRLETEAVHGIAHAT